MKYKSVIFIEVHISALEAFGYAQSKIKIYDLLNKKNSSSDWQKKHGSISFDPKNATKIPIKSRKDCITVTSFFINIRSYIRYHCIYTKEGYLH